MTTVGVVGRPPLLPATRSLPSDPLELGLHCLLAASGSGYREAGPEPRKGPEKRPWVGVPRGPARACDSSETVFLPAP